jgi:hypothetical protein
MINLKQDYHMEDRPKRLAHLNYRSPTFPFDHIYVWSVTVNVAPAGPFSYVDIHVARKSNISFLLGS